MKIIAICGSLSHSSVNLRILNSLAEMIDDTHTYEVVTLHDIPMFDPNLDTPPQSVQRLADRIASADRIIFGSPEYNYSLPGVLKNAIDWLSRSPNKPLAHKTSAIIGASPGRLGTSRMQYDLRKIGVFLEINFLNRPEVMIGGAYTIFDGDGTMIDEEVRGILIQLIDAITS